MTSESLPSSKDDSSPSFSDPLASALWQARLRVGPLQAADWPDISAARGQAVGAELYAALRAAGETLRGAKLGVTDKQAQRNLGADGPMVAPIHDGAAIEDGATISLAELIAPKLEPEFGLRVEHGEIMAVPCIEIIDSRWSGDVTIGHLMADFGWQARMMFGPASAPPSHVDVVVSHDGKEQASGSQELERVTPAIALTRAAIEGFDELAVAFVATGTIVPAIPLAVGRWVVDFGALGTLELNVEA
jgi:2-keto-4-pentenoate hydratase